MVEELVVSTGKQEKQEVCADWKICNLVECL